jgi:tripartite-type tricarboxylate transporter receptor subunit TctC
MIPRLRTVFAPLGLVAILAMAGIHPVAAQDSSYPNKATTIIVPFAPGGVTDFLARLVGEKLSERFGKSYVIENKGGGGMIVGAVAASKAAPDGYTLLMATNGTLAINPTFYRALPYMPLKDLVPVSLVGSLPFVLLVNPTLPVKNIRDLIDLAKQKPGQLNFASGGVGSSGHMFGELLQTAAGIKLVHVAYRGNTQALTDLVAGRIQIVFSDIGSSAALVQAGKLRALAVTTPERFPGTPDIPTLAEAGVPGYSAESWQMLVAPAGTPSAILTKLNTETNRVISSPEVREKLLQMGVTPKGTGTTGELSKFVQSEMERWGAVVRDAGFAGRE